MSPLIGLPGSIVVPPAGPAPCSGNGQDVLMCLTNAGGGNYNLEYIDCSVGSPCFGNQLLVVNNWMTGFGSRSIQGATFNHHQDKLAVLSLASNALNAREFNFNAAARAVPQSYTFLTNTWAESRNRWGFAYDRNGQDKYYFINHTGHEASYIEEPLVSNPTITVDFNPAVYPYQMCWDINSDALWIGHTDLYRKYDASPGNEGNILASFPTPPWTVGSANGANIGQFANGDFIVYRGQNSGYLIRFDQSGNVVENGWGTTAWALDSFGNGYGSYRNTQGWSAMNGGTFIEGWAQGGLPY